MGAGNSMSGMVRWKSLHFIRLMLRDDLIAISVRGVEMLLQSGLDSIGQFFDLF